MAHNNVLDPARAALITVDIQEGFRHAIPDFSVLATRVLTAIRGFQALSLPILITEQYPKGLGHTAEEITFGLQDNAEIFEKTSFSAGGAGALLARIETLGVDQIVLCGLETHVCVNQTAHDLLNRGFEVHLLTDCVRSRFEQDERAGIAKMKVSGVIPSSVETALFELLGDSLNESFKEVHSLIK